MIEETELVREVVVCNDVVGDLDAIYRSIAKEVLNRVDLAVVISFVIATKTIEVDEDAITQVILFAKCR
jgi:hypothetical protein